MDEEDGTERRQQMKNKPRDGGNLQGTYSIAAPKDLSITVTIFLRLKTHTHTHLEFRVHAARLAHDKAAAARAVPVLFLWRA
jgi:hypothetical protein